MVRLALYQPEIAGNVGTVARLAACFGVPLDVIEPCGFPFSTAALRRSAMDYLDQAEVARHHDWAAFERARVGRLVLMSTTGDAPLPVARFTEGDVLLMGSESAGVPAAVRAQADLTVRIPIMPGLRSLNVAVAAGIALGEALRQTAGFPAWR